MTDIISTTKKRGKPALTKEIVNERLKGRDIRMVGDHVTLTTKSAFECSKGHQWNARVNNLLAGMGCPHCSGLAPLTKGIVNKRLIDRGLRMVGAYVNAHTKSTFECSGGHQWVARVDSVINGKGCPACASHGFDQSKPAILYYLRVTSPVHGTKYKIGITNRTVEQRFSADDLSKVDVISVTEYLIGADAMGAERDILRHFKADRYEGDPILSSGNTEIFTRDVLRLDLTRQPEVV